MNKFHFIFDKTTKSKKLKKIFLSKYKNFSIKDSNAIIVGGGDGFMLTSLKKYIKYKKPFYGVNCGTYGFLMNKNNSFNLEKKIRYSKKTIINPLEIIGKKKRAKNLIAINEVSIFRQSKQTAIVSIQAGNKKIINKLVGDGVLISTPAGSTAYNLSVHGPILSLNSGKLAVTPISPFRPRRWRGKIISNNMTIKIKNLYPIKRPIAAVADNIEMRNIKNLKVRVNKKLNITLLHDPEKTLEKRIKIEQLKKKIKKK
jgi:NAD+ kinase